MRDGSFPTEMDRRPFQSVRGPLKVRTLSGQTSGRNFRRDRLEGVRQERQARAEVDLRRGRLEVKRSLWRKIGSKKIFVEEDWK